MRWSFVLAINLSTTVASRRTSHDSICQLTHIWDRAFGIVIAIERSSSGDSFIVDFEMNFIASKTEIGLKWTTNSMSALKSSDTWFVQGASHCLSFQDQGSVAVLAGDRRTELKAVFQGFKVVEVASLALIHERLASILGCRVIISDDGVKDRGDMFRCNSNIIFFQS